jgi:hypothetical protein
VEEEEDEEKEKKKKEKKKKKKKKTNNKCTLVGLQVKCPVFVSDFNETSIFSIYYPKTIPYPIS